MKKVIIFGAGGMGKEIYNEICNRVQVVAFWDNAAEEGAQYNGVPICKPETDMGYSVDKIILGACYPSMRAQLIDMGLDEDAIEDKYVERRVVSRIKFLENFARLAKENIDGCCAEAGVFQGEFAQYINKFFPDRKLYLFDTFEGFAEQDVSIEAENNLSPAKSGQYSLTSEEIVLSKMEYPENCVIRKGFFPETAQGIEEQFCFVNLDMDLYQPTLEGLKFFCDKMSKNGVILVHDYFSHYRGVEKAVSEFLQEKDLRIIPIGDEISVAIVGF